jgi:hypothetical protein
VGDPYEKLLVAIERDGTSPNFSYSAREERVFWIGVATCAVDVRRSIRFCEFQGTLRSDAP